MITLFRDTFEYFAKFPDHDGVMELFGDSSSLFTSEYPAFKTKIQNLTEKSLIPGIKDFIFGVDREMVIQRVKNLDGYYLFVDYGSLTGERDENKVKSESLMLAITVAFPRDPKSLDQIEQVLMADQAMDYIGQIRKKMVEDSRNSPFVQHLSFPNEITPFFARELENSVGSSMIFTRDFIDLFG